MASVSSNYQEIQSLEIGKFTLISGQHYQMTSSGIVLIKSGHLWIQQCIKRAPDRGEAAASMIEGILKNSAFSESTFDSPHRPSSLFRCLSRKCINLIPASYTLTLQSNLYHDDALIARRSAKMLVHIYETAASYPDVATFLYCYFWSDSVTAHKFAWFTKDRLLKAKEQNGFLEEYTKITEELQKFESDFRPVLQKVGTLATSGENEFSGALGLLKVKLDSQRRNFTSSEDGE